MTGYQQGIILALGTKAEGRVTVRSVDRYYPDYLQPLFGTTVLSVADQHNPEQRQFAVKSVRVDLPRLDEITDWKGFCRAWIEIHGMVFPATRYRKKTKFHVAGFRIYGAEDVLTAMMPHLRIRPKKLEKISNKVDGGKYIGTTYCINISSPAEAAELLRYFDEAPQNAAVWTKFHQRAKEINGSRPVQIKPGDRFGKLTVVVKTEDKMRENGKGKIYSRWLCQCDCGNMTTVPAGELRSGSTRSCGCLKLGPKLKQRKKRVCPVCGKEFEVHVNSTHRICSPECARAADLQKKWRVMSADGNIYEFRNLSRWARKHIFLFNVKAITNIISGFNAIRCMAEFPDREWAAKAYQYRGWTYAQGGAEQPRAVLRARPIRRVCAVCGKEFTVKSSESAPACSPECAEKFEKSRWALRSEDGDMYEFYDLPRWVQKHYVLFEPDADDAADAAERIADGIVEGRYPGWAIEKIIKN